MISWLFARLRNIRYSIQNRQGRSLIFGTIYKMSMYRNWKNDPAPLIYVMYSGPMRFTKTSGHYTDGINLNYLSVQDKMWLARTIYLMRKGGQQMNGRLFYRFLKTQRPNIVRTAYRRYHTSMINKPRLVSAGITNLDKLVYPYNDPFIQRLNESISPTELRATGVQVAYSPTELRDRITQAQNSQSIQSIRMNQPKPQAPWVKKI